MAPHPLNETPAAAPFSHLANPRNASTHLQEKLLLYILPDMSESRVAAPVVQVESVDDKQLMRRSSQLMPADYKDAS